MPLNSVDLAGPVEEWKDLAAVDDGSNQYLGDLCLSLRYVPSSGKLTGKHVIHHVLVFNQGYSIKTKSPNKCLNDFFFSSGRIRSSQTEENGHYRCFRSIRED